MPTSACCHPHVFGHRESARGAHRSASCDSYRGRPARTAAEDGMSRPPSWRHGTERGASRTAGRSWTPSAWPPATTATTSSRYFEGDGGRRCVNGGRGPALRPGVQKALLVAALPRRLRGDVRLASRPRTLAHPRTYQLRGLRLRRDL